MLDKPSHTSTHDVPQDPLPWRAPSRKKKRRLGIPFDDIKVIVAGYYKMPLSDLNTKFHNRQIGEKCNIAMYLAYIYCVKSFFLVGKNFGGRVHTTASYGVRRVAWLVGDKKRMTPRAATFHTQSYLDATLVADVAELKRLIEEKIAAP